MKQPSKFKNLSQDLDEVPNSELHTLKGGSQTYSEQVYTATGSIQPQDEQLLIYGMNSAMEDDTEEWDIEELNVGEPETNNWAVQSFSEGEGGEGEGEEGDGGEEWNVSEEPGDGDEEPSETIGIGEDNEPIIVIPGTPGEPEEEPWEPVEEPVAEEPIEEDFGGDEEPSEDPTLSDLINYINALFPGVLVTVNAIVTTGHDFLPTGYTRNSDGSFTYSGGNPPVSYVAEAVTYVVGDQTVILISDGLLDPSTPSWYRDNVIGHELLHAKHINTHQIDYKYNRAQFNLNSELAAYQFSYNRAMAAGDTATANYYNTEMNALIARGAQSGYSTYP